MLLTNDKFVFYLFVVELAALAKEMSFEIPPGLTGMLQDFTVAVLRNKPPDLHKFASEYFANLYEKKLQGKLGKEGCQQKAAKSAMVKSEPKPMELADASSKQAKFSADDERSLSPRKQTVLLYGSLSMFYDCIEQNYCVLLHIVKGS